MTKVFSRAVALLLAVGLLFSLPAISFAADETIEISGCKVTSASGNWNADYVERVRLTLDCKANALNISGSNVLLTVTAADKVIKTVTVNDAAVSFNGNKITVEFALSQKLVHADNYDFNFNEGAFKDAGGRTSEAYTYTESGNMIIEAISVSPIAVRPIDKLIIYLSSSKYHTLFIPFIFVLKWFASL